MVRYVEVTQKHNGLHFMSPIPKQTTNKFIIPTASSNVAMVRNMGSLRFNPNRSNSYRFKLKFLLIEDMLPS